MTEDTNTSGYIIRLARSADIPAVRSMQERSMWVLGGDFYSANEIASFLTLFGTMDDAVVDEGHYFVAEDSRGAILGSGGWTRSRPRYANASAGTQTPAEVPTVRSVFVDPAATRRGVASAIMSRTERDALDHGVETLQPVAPRQKASSISKRFWILQNAAQSPCRRLRRARSGRSIHRSSRPSRRHSTPRDGQLFRKSACPDSALISAWYIPTSRARFWLA